MVVIEYWTERALERMESASRQLDEIVEDSWLEESVEAMEGFDYVEGEVVEYEGETHTVEERNVWISLAVSGNQYRIEDETGYTKTVFEDDIL